jgi:hypothetical protein
MPIRELLRGADAFSPEDVVILTDAYDHAVADLGLKDHTDKLRLARIVVDAARVGGRLDRDQLQKTVIQVYQARYSQV